MRSTTRTRLTRRSRAGRFAGSRSSRGSRVSETGYGVGRMYRRAKRTLTGV